METIYRTWNCCDIASNSKYIAALGTGVTILDRTSLEQVHHFTGMRLIHGGLFVNEDVLLVYTGEQRLFFLQVSSKSILWECRRPNELASTGDMCCCLIPGTEMVVCIARGKKSLNEHYLLLADYRSNTLSVHPIPNVYRVTESLVWTEGIGLNFLSHQIDNGKILCRITAIAPNAEPYTIYEWESSEHISVYSGSYFFIKDYSKDEPKAYCRRVIHNLPGRRLALGDECIIPFHDFLFKQLGCVRKHLPDICWVNEEKGLLSARYNNWLGIYDFKNARLVAEYELENPWCTEIVDERLFVGCCPGLMVEDNFLPQ